MSVGTLTLHIQLPGCTSLKEKRRRLKPLLIRIHKEFNVSVAEIDRLDAWQESVLVLALVSNDNRHTQRSLQIVIGWIEKYWPDVTLIEHKLELY
jgi:uncharacterized protein YlxP (DUF503 family)